MFGEEVYCVALQRVGLHTCMEEVEEVGGGAWATPRVNTGPKTGAGGGRAWTPAPITASASGCLRRSRIRSLSHSSFCIHGKDV